MGAPKGAPLTYRDDADAVSLHTTPGDDFEAESTQRLLNASAAPPPTYADATVQGPVGGIPGQGMNQSTPERLPSGMPTGINFDKRWTTQGKSYKVIGQDHKLVGEVNKLQEPRTDQDADYLEAVIREMASHAPTPYIQIIGTHRERRKRDRESYKHETVTDFKILINMRNYLWPGFNVHSSNDMDLRIVENGEKVHRGTIFKNRAPGYTADLEVGEPKAELREWCHRYCASHAPNRIFRVTRKIIGMDTELLKARIDHIIRSTNYKGHISISFPVGDKHVDMYTSNTLQTWRLTTWIRWMFYLTFLWIFSWPVLFFTTKKYAVVRAEWPFSKPTSNGGKTYTTVSEEQWLERFGLAVRKLVLDQFQGEAGDDLLTQTLARGDPPQGRVDVGRAVNAVSGGMGGGLAALSGANALSRMAVGESGDQLGWGYDT